jgi:hypothetical protein
MIITVLEVTLLCEADCLFTSGMKVRCWHEVGLHMTDYYARTHHHKSVKILQKNKLHHGEERKDHHMQV